MNSLEILEERKIVPIAAMISAGKSKLLNVIYNINFLECKRDIGTKFVNILRYNPNIEEPMFYHLKLQKQKGKYIFYKDLNSLIKGEDNIIEENKNINNVLAANLKVDFQDIFYITEINNVEFIKDKEYLLTHDLCDIPGLSESLTNQINNNETVEKKETKKTDDEKLEEKFVRGARKYGLVYSKRIFNTVKPKKKEKEKKKEEQTEEKTYLTEIFEILRQNIDGIILVLSQENYNFNKNFEIIKKLHKVIQKDITNSLIILNKIDLSPDVKSDIDKCKGLFIKHFPDGNIFNLNLNTFTAISAIQLQNELLMSKKYSNLVNYFFYNYKSYVKRNETTEGNSFIDHLKLIILSEEGNIEKLKEEINQIDIREYEIMKKEILLVIKELTENFKVDNLLFGICEKDVEEDDDDDDENDELTPFQVMKILYVFHKKKKLIPPISEETNKLLNFFKSNKIENQIVGKDQKKELTKSNEEIINTLECFCQEIKQNQTGNNEFQILIDELTKLIHFLKIYNVIFIPFLGVSNSGKTTIINGIIGRDLLPTASKECTKRGIVIGYRDDDNIIINKLNFLSEEFLGFKNYWFRIGPIIAVGEDKVKDTLNNLNYDFNEKEEDSFYLITMRIKLFDDMFLNESLKKMIYLIDFPGFGTGNKFEENNLYNKVMSICNSFFFVTKNSVIKDEDSESMLNSIFNDVQFQKNKLTSQFIKLCLFIFNVDNESSFSKEEEEKGKKNIQSIIKGIDTKDINLCFYNAKYYYNYCSNYNYFFNLNNILKQEYYNFKNEKSYAYYVPSLFKKKSLNFFESMKIKLEGKVKTLFNVNQKEIYKNQVINKDIEKNFDEIVNHMDDDVLLTYKSSQTKPKILKLLSYAQENFSNLNILKESNIEEFKKSIIFQLHYINDIKQVKLKENMENVLAKLDLFFNKDFEERKKDLGDISKLNENVYYIENSVSSLLKYMKDTISKSTNDYKKKLTEPLKCNKQIKLEQLESKNYKEILNEINNEMSENLKGLEKTISEILKYVEAESTTIFQNGKKRLDECLGKNKMDFNIKIGLISDVSKRLRVKKSLEKELFEQIKNSCENTKSIWTKKSFFDWLSSLFFDKNYLDNVIDILIETTMQKINWVFNILERECNRYLVHNKNEIISRVRMLTLKFTDEQKKKWEKLCQSYEKNKKIILKIKN